MKDTNKNCIHCGNPFPLSEAGQFCCQGCQNVYHWISGHGLEHYYDLKPHKETKTPKLVIRNNTTDAYSYLDEVEFLTKYSKLVNGYREMDFYLEGVHCAACVWITEKMPEIISGVAFVRLNLATSVANVKLLEIGHFSDVARTFLNMGYESTPVLHGEEKKLSQIENKASLVRLGISAAAAGNIMILAVAQYAGVSGTFSERFNWISFAIFLPVIFYCALPFYRTAWASLKNKELSMDVPVIFGITVSSIISTINLFQNNKQIYFDSISALVFLLLSTRYLLKKTQQASLTSSQLMHFLVPSRVKVFSHTEQVFVDKKLEQLNKGDLILVASGENIAADGVIVDGKSLINNSLLSGESDLVDVEIHSRVFAGTINTGSPIQIKITQSGIETRVGRIIHSMETLANQKAKTNIFADQISKYFVSAVLLSSALVFAWGLQNNWHDGLYRALAIVIVTCPCTFALITPLAFTLTIGKLAKKGFLVKSSETIENLAEADQIFLDKTGTLTNGSLLRPDTKKAIQDLKSLKLNVWILSGDKKSNVESIAKQIDIEPSHCLSEASPEQKRDVLKQNKKSLMVGDGANDALALVQALVGISVRSGIEIGIKSGDVYSKNEGIQSIPALIKIARGTLIVVKRNLKLSLIYNLIALGFAVSGKISPLFAAVLMPASALTLFLSTIIGTKTMRKTFLELPT